MRTKTILRFAVTIVILGLIFLGVWLIWFKPTNELEVFNTLTNLQKADNKSKGYGAYLYAMSGVDDNNNPVGLTNCTDGIEYNGTSYNKYFKGINFSVIGSNGLDKTVSADIPKYIKYYRFFMLGELSGVNQDYVNANPYYKQGVYEDNADTQVSYVGLQKMYDNIDKAFDYYYAYVQLAQKVDKQDVKEINNLAKALTNSYNNFASTKSELDSLLNKLSSNPDGGNPETIMFEVKNLFKTLHSDYFNIVKNYNNLTMTVRDFVIKYAFDNDFAYNKETVYYDILLSSVKEFTSKSINLFVEVDKKEFVANCDDKNTDDKNTDGINYSTDYVTYSLDVARVIKNGQQDVVTDYIELKNNYSTALTGTNSLFALSHADKQRFVNSDAEVTSKFNENYISYISNIFNKCFGISKIG